MRRLQRGSAVSVAIVFGFDVPVGRLGRLDRLRDQRGVYAGRDAIRRGSLWKLRPRPPHAFAGVRRRLVPLGGVGRLVRLLRGRPVLARCPA